MFYEGTEKRLEITVKHTNLLLFPECFWQEMVAQAGAFILSKIENDTIRAYLLSESSLFIWQNRLLLITCGNTHLVKAAQFFQRKHSKEKIQSLLFQRHHPIESRLQKSNFSQDVVLLKTQLQGITQHWQKEYKGDLFFFGEIDNEPLISKQILMLHSLSGAFTKQLQAGKVSTVQIESTLSLNAFFPQLSIDQFTFTPKGYSLNAIAGNDYLTLHITPENLSSYLSLESSFSVQQMNPFIDHLLSLFKPSKSQLMCFTKDANNALVVSVTELKGKAAGGEQRAASHVANKLEARS